MIACYSCAATEAQGAVFPPRKRGRPAVCNDCVAEAVRSQDAVDQRFVRLVQADAKRRNKDKPVRIVVTRRAAAAQRRARDGRDQADLVDLIGKQ